MLCTFVINQVCMEVFTKMYTSEQTSICIPFCLDTLTFMLHTNYSIILIWKPCNAVRRHNQTRIHKVNMDLKKITCF